MDLLSDQIRIREIINLPYQPRCNKCLQLGHESQFCQKDILCRYCGKTHNTDNKDEDNPCINLKVYTCVNCAELGHKHDHEAFDPKCNYKREYMTRLRNKEIRKSKNQQQNQNEIKLQKKLTTNNNKTQ
jgi:hypothetical protein